MSYKCCYNFDFLIFTCEKIDFPIDDYYDFMLHTLVDSVIKSLRGLPWLNPSEVCTYVHFIKKGSSNFSMFFFWCHLIFFVINCYCSDHDFEIDLFNLKQMFLPRNQIRIELPLDLSLRVFSSLLNFISLCSRRFSFIDVYIQIMQSILHSL